MHILKHQNQTPTTAIRNKQIQFINHHYTHRKTYPFFTTTINMPCPNIDFCPAKVDFQHYQEYCLSEDNWQNCKYYVKYEMTPAQWKKYAGETLVRREGREVRFF